MLLNFYQNSTRDFEFTKELQNNSMGFDDRAMTSIRIRWVYSPLKWVKINVDGTLNPSLRKVGDSVAFLGTITVIGWVASHSIFVVVSHFKL